jgi:hypothetical protein
MTDFVFLRNRVNADVLKGAGVADYTPKQGCPMRSHERFVPCNAGDWAYDCDYTCSDKSEHSTYRCLPMDARACPAIEGLNPNTVRVRLDQYDGGPCGQASQNATVSCGYGVDLIAGSEATLNAWKAKWQGVDTANFAAAQNTVMERFCAQPEADAAKYCALDPRTGKPMTSCGRMSSTSTAGDACREWGAGVPDLADGVKLAYCKRYPHAPDCRCLARSVLHEDAYDLVKRSFPGIRDSCWWSPCSEGGAIGPYLHVNEDDVSTCPKAACSQYNRIVAGKDIDLSGVTYTQECKVSADAAESLAELVPASDIAGDASTAGPIVSDQLASDTPAPAATVTNERLYTNSEARAKGAKYLPAGAHCDEGACPLSTHAHQPCDTGDWTQSNRTCCADFQADQWDCIKIDGRACPNVGVDASGVALKAANGSLPALPGTQATVACTYDADQIAASLPSVRNWRNTWQDYDPAGVAAQYDVVMQRFCSKAEDSPKTACPIDPDTGAPMTMCSRMHAMSQAGDLCDAWAATNRNLADGAKDEYCAHNPHSPDCRCLSRGFLNEPAYVKMRDMLHAMFPGTPDACWWTPCIEGGSAGAYLHTGVDDRTQCPEVVCTQVNDFEAKDNIDWSQVSYTQNCGGAAPPPPPPPPPPPSPPSPAGLTTAAKVAIGIAAGGAALALVGVAIALAARQRRGGKK